MKNIQNLISYKKGYIYFCRQMPLSHQNWEKCRRGLFYCMILHASINLSRYPGSLKISAGASFPHLAYYTNLGTF